MKRDGSALPLVRDLDLQSQDVAELAFEGIEVSVDNPGSVASARPPGLRTVTGSALVTPNALLDLAH